jgi:DNA-binding NtrC family response regulator
MLIAHLEDDSQLRHIFKTALTALEPEIVVVQFADSDQLIHYLDEKLREIRVFVLDIRVPGQINGMGIANEIRRRGSLRPIVVTSAYQKPSKDILDELGITWMPKPTHILSAAREIIPMTKKP